MTKVYIVIVNFNGLDHTIECIESVLKSSYKNFQLILIDNSSNDLSYDGIVDWLNGDRLQRIRTSFPDLVFPLTVKPIPYVVQHENKFSHLAHPYDEKIILIRALNRGFAAANNIALEYVKDHAPDQSLIWLLNNDVVIEKNTLAEFVAFYENSLDKQIILGGKLRLYYQPAYLQAIMGRYNNWLGKHYHIGEGELDNGQHDNYVPKKNNYIVGASIFLPKLFLQKAGLMSEDYFLYFEELDWIRTGERFGFKIAFVPRAVVYHKEGSSIIESKNNSRDTSLAEYYSIINRVRFIKKWYPYCLVTVLVGVTFALVKRLLKGNFGLVKKSVTAIFKILF
jgi:GT2 family glycosyltransferase